MPPPQRPPQRPRPMYPHEGGLIFIWASLSFAIDARHAADSCPPKSCPTARCDGRGSVRWNSYWRRAAAAAAAAADAGRNTAATTADQDTCTKLVFFHFGFLYCARMRTFSERTRQIGTDHESCSAGRPGAEVVRRPDRDHMLSDGAVPRHGAQRRDRIPHGGGLDLIRVFTFFAHDAHHSAGAMPQILVTRRRAPAPVEDLNLVLPISIGPPETSRSRRRGKALYSLVRRIHGLVDGRIGREIAR